MCKPRKGGQGQRKRTRPPCGSLRSSCPLSVFNRPPLSSLIRMGPFWPYCSFPAWIVSALIFHPQLSIPRKKQTLFILLFNVKAQSEVNTHTHPLTCVLFIITHSLLCVPTPNLFGHRRVLVSCSVALIWKTRRHSAFGVSGWRSSLFLCDKNRLFWQLACLHLFPHFPSHLGLMHRWKNTFYKAWDWNNTWTVWSTLICLYSSAVFIAISFCWSFMVLKLNP